MCMSCAGALTLRCGKGGAMGTILLLRNVAKFSLAKVCRLMLPVSF